MRKTLCLFVFLLVVVTPVVASTSLLNTAVQHSDVNYHSDGNQIILTTPAGHVRIEFCTPEMFRVRCSSGTEFPENEQWMVRKYVFHPVHYAIQDKDSYLFIETEKLNIHAYKNPFKLDVFDKNGQSLYSELKGQRLFADSVKNVVALQPDEHFFGLGERMDFLDQRGKKVYLNVELGRGAKPAVGGKDILRANYCPVPFVMSTKGYGIFFHTGYPTEWNMGWDSKDWYSFKAFGGELDYYFIYGPDFYTLIDRYTDLTGKSPMLPRFAMGLHVGTYSGGTWKYESATGDRYPVQLARRLRMEGVPFDLLWLDSTWRMFNSTFGNGGCTFEWRDTFKDPNQMFKDVYAENVKMMGLHVRSILDNGPEFKLLDQAREKGNILVPHAGSEGLVNFFDPAAVDWWWENGARKVVDKGAMFFKTDVGGTYRLNENASPEEKSKAAALHNLFPLAYAEAPYRKFEEQNQMRGLTHTREGYAGIQRYPYIWAGDWGSEWQWFEPVIRAGLNIGMSGVGNWTHCMGVFEQYSPYDTELYIRWCQFGMFSPIAMVFGMDHPRYHEPWTYGKEALENFKKYARLRYSLIPYIYTLSYRLHQTACPMMTPLVMDYPQDENTYNLSRQYMFGPWMMVCPVTTKGALSQPVYFPGGEWFDYETGERIAGRQYKSFLTPIDLLPIYIKAGAIIPMQQPMEWVDQEPVDVLTLDVYPSGNTSFEMYEDDGLSLDYKREIQAITRFTSELTGNNWVFTAEKPVGSFKPAAHTYLIKARLDYMPEKITENGKVLPRLDSVIAVEEKAGWYYDEATKRLWIKTIKGNETKVQLTAE